MTNEEWDPYATEEIPVTQGVGHDPYAPQPEPDLTPTEPIPVARPDAQPAPPVGQPTPPAPIPAPAALETTARLPRISEPRRPFPFGAVIRRVVLRFVATVALLLLIAVWTAVLRGSTGLDAFVMPEFPPLAIWSAIYTGATVALDVAGWGALPLLERKLPTRRLAVRLVALAVLLRPIAVGPVEQPAWPDVVAWLLAAYGVGMVITVVVLRLLPEAQERPAGATGFGAVLVGAAVAILGGFPLFAGYPGAEFVSAFYDWAFGWLHPGLAPDGDPTILLVVALVLGMTVLVFARRWRGLGRGWEYVPGLVALLLLVILIALHPTMMVHGIALGLPVWVLLLVFRGADAR